MSTEPAFPDIIPPEDRAAYRRAGVGRLMGYGRRPAVLVVDMCRYTTEAEHPLSCPATARPAARSIARLLASARKAGIPVVFTTQRTAEPYDAATGGRLIDKAIPLDSGFARDAAPHEIVDEVRPARERRSSSSPSRARSSAPSSQASSCSTAWTPSS